MPIEPQWLLEITDMRLNQACEALAWLIGRHHPSGPDLPEALDKIRSAHATVQRLRLAGPDWRL